MNSADLLTRLYEQPEGTTVEGPSFTHRMGPCSSSPTLAAASCAAGKHSSSAALRCPAGHSVLLARVQRRVGAGDSASALLACAEAVVGDGDGDGLARRLLALHRSLKGRGRFAPPIQLKKSDLSLWVARQRMPLSSLGMASSSGVRLEDSASSAGLSTPSRA